MIFHKKFWKAFHHYIKNIWTRNDISLDLSFSVKKLKFCIHSSNIKSVSAIWHWRIFPELLQKKINTDIIKFNVRILNYYKL